MPRTLTVLAAIRPGEEERLRDVLRPIGDDIRGHEARANAGPRPHIDFVRSRRDPLRALRDPRRSGPRTRPQAPALLVELRRRSRRPPGRVDGDHLRHGRDLGPLRRLHGRRAISRAFIRAHAHEPEAFYIAFRDETVERIQQCHRASAAGAAAARRRVGRPARGDPPAPVSRASRPGPPTSAARSTAAGRVIGAAIERLIARASDRGRRAEGDRPVRLRERLSAARSGSSPASTDTRCSGG